MRWKGRRQSRHVEDRRSQRSGAYAGGGSSALLRLLPLLLGKKRGKFTLVLIVGLLAAQYFGVDIGGLLGASAPGGQVASESRRVADPAEDELAKFVSVVLADTEESWHSLFQKMNRRYEEPTLVLFSGSVRSACGSASSAMGPFYCPADRKVYIDLSFYQDLKNRHGAPGDFAQAYVIAHEVGHHVQTLLGISQKVHQQRQSVSQTAGNRLSVKQELQADCFAGLWAHQAERFRQLLEPGDLEEALNAASAIGDDRLQKQARGRVVPDSFTHGSSAQRVSWFRRGYEAGTLEACDTFAAGAVAG